ncbi:MAG: transcriptional regulator NrdR [Candidatus Komeilibacteria bacterium RIFCSPLOWO2_02_FULL_48_11]|uniref:Transcriptional repressor NrdR n=1 Tax=Candidatus Komeilibacteria bacterium RIFCSPLOWO2_02_FULL_48_11 TaxID=1798553 RepID=A0A1G2BRE2_9BACT|nr:MAG: transcriptional regulator NrdR [Candidatus Komeilibacteria bacterium RIFCSPLOWO2_02_FULL_48_11]
MHCPACNYDDTKVLDSRLSENENAVRRRRTCLKCKFRFSTLEETEILDLSVIKRDGRREAYSRSKIEGGVLRALEKRPVTKQEFRSLISGIERDIYVLNRPEIKTSEIGEIAMRHLQKVDQVAYIRFASVYRAFTDVSNFREEISKLAPTRRQKSSRLKKKKIALSRRRGRATKKR